MKRYIPHILCTLALAGAVLVGLLVPPQPAYGATDPKASPTPNWCCDFAPSRYCTLCPAKLRAQAIIVKPSPTPSPDCMYTGKQCTSGGQLPPAAALGLQEPKATPTPNACAKPCFRDTRGICWCPK